MEDTMVEGDMRRRMTETGIANKMGAEEVDVEILPIEEREDLVMVQEIEDSLK